MSQSHYIAVDLGASSGRVMLASLAGGKLSLREVHRFPNGPIEENGSLQWDFEALFGEIKTGIQQALAVEKNVQSIGIDTWGVDFGLLDKDGNIIENPYHYRDSRTEGMIEKAAQILRKRKSISTPASSLCRSTVSSSFLPAKTGPRFWTRRPRCCSCPI